MSYSNQLQSQGDAFANIRGDLAERGRQKIADYDMDQEIYTGDMIAHRSGLSNIEHSQEMPRLFLEYNGVKPLLKKLAPVIGEKTGISQFLTNKFKGSKIENVVNNIKEGYSAASEGRYGDLADMITDGKGVNGVKEFATNSLTKAKSMVGDNTTPFEDARENVNSWIKRSVGGGPDQEVRQIGGARFNSMSPEDRANVAKGSVDEDEIPFRPEELQRGDVYKGLQSGRFRYSKDSGLEDLASGQKFEATTSNRLLGGGRLKIGEGGQMSFTSEGGEPYSAERAFGGGGDPGDAQTPYQASQQYADTSRSFSADPSYKRGLDNLSAEQDRLTGSVDFGRSTGRPVDPEQLKAPGKRRAFQEEPQPQEEQELSGQFRTTPGQRVRIRQQPRQDDQGGGGGGAEDEPLIQRDEGGGGGGPAEEEGQAFTPQPDTLQGGGQSFSRDTPVADRPSGPYGSGRDTGTDRFEPDVQARPISEQPAMRTRGPLGPEPEGPSALSRGELDPMLRNFKSEPGASPPSSMRGQYSKPTDSGRSATTDDTPMSEIPKPGKTLGEDIGKSELETAPVEEAEATLPGVGEVLMGLTALGGIIKGAIQQHREMKQSEAQTPVAPTQPALQTSGINMDTAPVIDSTDFHHL